MLLLDVGIWKRESPFPLAPLLILRLACASVFTFGDVGLDTGLRRLTQIIGERASEAIPPVSPPPLSN